MMTERSEQTIDFPIMFLFFSRDKHFIGNLGTKKKKSTNTLVSQLESDIYTLYSLDRYKKIILPRLSRNLEKLKIKYSIYSKEHYSSSSHCYLYTNLQNL